MLDLQLPMQSVPITTTVVSSNPVHDGVYLIQQYVIKFANDLRQVMAKTMVDKTLHRQLMIEHYKTH
jgi:DNA integrity scanning protein DisA with diadenylate cyclase activity